MNGGFLFVRRTVYSNGKTHSITPPRIGTCTKQVSKVIRNLSAIENGKEKPSLEKFISICNFLKTTPDFLLLGTLHPCNVSQNIYDNLRLCNPDDIKIIEQIIEIFVAHNQKSWNTDYE